MFYRSLNNIQKQHKKRVVFVIILFYRLQKMSLSIWADQP